MQEQETKEEKHGLFYEFSNQLFALFAVILICCLPFHVGSIILHRHFECIPEFGFWESATLIWFVLIVRFIIIGGHGVDCKTWWRQ
jgi:hypothetical protein